MREEKEREEKKREKYMVFLSFSFFFILKKSSPLLLLLSLPSIIILGCHGNGKLGASHCRWRSVKVHSPSPLSPLYIPLSRFSNAISSALPAVSFMLYPSVSVLHPPCSRFFPLPHVFPLAFPILFPLYTVLSIRREHERAVLYRRPFTTTLPRARKLFYWELTEFSEGKLFVSFWK